MYTPGYAGKQPSNPGLYEKMDVDYDNDDHGAL